MTSSRSWSRRLRGCALALALLCGATVAQGAPRGKFLQRYEEGLRLYKAERYSEAIEVFRAAYALKQLPRVLFNLGQAHLKLGNAQEALRYYEQYLALEPSPPQEIRSKLDFSMAQARASLQAVAPQQGPGDKTDETGAAPAPLPRGPREEADRAATGEGGQQRAPAAPTPAPPGPVEAPPAAAPSPPGPPAAAPSPPGPPAAAVSPHRPLRGLPLPKGEAQGRAPRPIWRLASGGVLLAGGATLLGFGAGALAVNGQCTEPVIPPAKSCDFDFATQPLGIGLLVGGVVALGAGAIAVAWPGPRRVVHSERSAAATASLRRSP